MGEDLTKKGEGEVCGDMGKAMCGGAGDGKNSIENQQCGKQIRGRREYRRKTGVENEWDGELRKSVHTLIIAR